MEDQNSPVIFSDWIKHRRKALDLTQDELAKRAGCSVSALRKIESGERRPSKQLAGLLAQALEIPNEDQQTFIRVARGELNIERLRQPDAESDVPASDLWEFIENHQSRVDEGQSLVYRIPSPSTPLIGRDNELKAVIRLFNDPHCRLITLTGTGGVGKTRLAIEFGWRSFSEFPGGVFYIPLTPVKSPKEIVSAIADVLEFRFSGPSDPKEQLFNYIASDIKQEALFILDNLEHLLFGDSTNDQISSVAELISAMMEFLPNVKILGTSRERLNLHGEWTYELYGLSVPPINFFGPMEEYDSIVLFLKSAQRIRPDFQTTPEEQQYIVQISQMVEGIPLAIELAAAWVDMLTCREIAQEIKANMDFLATSMRDIPERHRSIRATFDHSWNLLSDEERGVLCQLSVFRGGFDRKSAQQIAGASLPVLASLSAKSLIHRTEDDRFDLHEVIRQYASSHLVDQANKIGVYERHSEYYLAFLEDQGPLLKSASQQEAMRRLTGEVDNIYAAWAWAVRNTKFAQLEQASRAFGWYFEIAGMYREGIDQLELLVQALEESPQTGDWGKVLGLVFLHQALLNFRRGVFQQAKTLYEQSIAMLRPTGDQVLLADALVFLGTINYLLGNYEKARSLLEDGLYLARQNNEPWFEAWAIFNLGHIDGITGQYEQGYRQMLEGIGMWRALGDPQSIALGLNFIAPTLNNLGRFAEAKTFLYESITLCEQSKNRWGMGTAYRYLGLTCLATGQFTEAQSHLQKSLEIFGDFSQGWDIARSLCYLGDVAMMTGNFPEARTYYQDALQSSVEAHAIPIALDAILGLGELQAQAGKPEIALILCYHVLHHPSSESETKSRAQKLQTELEPGLEDNQVVAARSDAEEKTFDAIVKEALEMP